MVLGTLVLRALEKSRKAKQRSRRGGFNFITPVDHLIIVPVHLIKGHWYFDGTWYFGT